jgi:hypothetical protein
VQKGDVPGTLRLITAEFADMVSIITPELLKGMAAGELDPREAQFVGVDLSKNKTLARYVYQKLAAEQRDWAAIVFRIESQEWRISRIFRRTQSAKDPLDGLQELLMATEPFMEPKEGSPPSPRH